MQGVTSLTEVDESSIPTEHVRNGSNLNRTFTVRRKAAKRILPWDLPIDEIQLALPSPRDEVIRETNRPRLEEPLPTTANEAATKNTSHDTTVALPPDAATDHADSDPVTDAHPNTRASGVPRRWTPEEDVELTSAVTNTPKKKWGKKEKKTDWDAVAALIPGRTRNQCHDRWRNFLMYSIDETNGRRGKWTEDEDIKLKDAVHVHGGNNWDAIAALVPGRMRNQCHHRWHNALNPSIDGATRRQGKWTEDEDIKLKSLVHTHGGNNWDDISTLVSGRTKRQCRDRWHDSLDPSVGLATARVGKWIEDEDIKLKNSVHTHGGNNWYEIAMLVPGRTKGQCQDRWRNSLRHSSGGATRRMGRWTEDEDIKLKNSVHTHGGKNWDEIATLVPGRSKVQCRSRWQGYLKVQMRDGTDWVIIPTLLSGRRAKVLG